MVVPLHDDERIACSILRGDIPGLFGATASASDVQTLALAERVEGEPLMRPEALAVGRLDDTRRAVEKTAEKSPERPLADEADTGAVRLVEDRQSCIARARAHRALCQLPERHQRLGQVIRVNGVQEVALILAGIPRFVQLDAARAVHEPRVVPSREVGRTEPPHILQDRKSTRLNSSHGY